MDTRNLHKDLFGELLYSQGRPIAGVYRGENGTLLENRRVVVRHYKRSTASKSVSSDFGAPPHLVKQEMARLADYIHRHAKNDVEPDLAIWVMSKVFHDFLKIHPYPDGNGHIARILMVLLAETYGMHVSSNWTIHTRPYDRGGSICIQNYSAYPDLLCQYLKKWFGTWGKQ